ncbi:MAG: hypothetical protein M0R46_05150 [Candidatus Muirbacterium halophilum]|nr:hypothetical protein [Candidatus Muirbacterium halophilum]MCK9475282.1 hypothetical protein [Candidatus Muirbacterium halophilum]
MKKAFFIDYNQYSAAFNMAADFFIHKKCELENCCFLRFYGFINKTITLGRFQKADFLNNNEYNDYDKAFRMSGGRAVFHENDFTYCFTSSFDFFEDKSIKASYNKISKPFINVLSQKGIEVDVYKKASKDYFSKELCFSSVSLYEIKSNGKKLLGSAQYRTDKALSQHGTMYYEIPSFYKNNRFSEDIEMCSLVKEKDFIMLLKNEFEKVFNVKFENYIFSSQDKQNILNLGEKFEI